MMGNSKYKELTVVYWVNLILGLGPLWFCDGGKLSTLVWPSRKRETYWVNSNLGVAELASNVTQPHNIVC